MVDFKKLLDHPDKQKIIDKLLMGESCKDVAQYLKLKYSESDQGHLRLGTALLNDFQKTYMNTGEFINKVVQDEKSGKLDKYIAESLLKNKTWKQRLSEYADEKIDVNKKLAELFIVIEQRGEQIFDKIQENPGNTKLDYVMTKYYELHMALLEKIDKIVNKSPDQRIEHTYTVQMIESQSVALQEAIRRVLGRMEPELASTFMDMLSEEMQSVKDPYVDNSTNVTLKDKSKEVNKLLNKADKVGEALVEIEEADSE